MDSERWRRVDELFNAAIDLSAGQRPAYLHSACGDDSELRVEVESLLEADAQDDPGFEQIIPQTAEAVLDLTAPLHAGDRVGAYRVVRPIGQGGMGAVFLAERADDEFESQAAIKVLRTGAFDTDIIARFRNERQILANLNHPNIARLLDGGETKRGLPYVVMEFVDGRPVDTWCDERQLGVRERVEMFRRICDAVHYAHQNLVIHRDLKPGNVLVTADGTPKLLDFGIAKILGEGPQDETVTAPLNRIMTPAYASPEQVLGRLISTSSDVYSLGVILYQLLTGRAPYDLEDATPGEIERLVCEDDPPRPSQAAIGDEAAKQRGSFAERIRKDLAGDLDDIVLTALAKQTEERYLSVEQLSADLARWLDHLPVNARKHTWVYVAGKFVRRHKAGVAAAVAFVALILTFAVGMAVLARRIAQERDTAELERRKAAQTTEFLADIFRISDPGETRGNEVTARQILDLGAQRIDGELREQPEIRAEMSDVIGRVYQNLGLYNEAQDLIERSLEVREDVLGGEHPDVAASLNHLAKVFHDTGRYDEAGELYQRSLALSRAASGRDDLVAQNLNDLAMLQRDQGRFDNAESMAEEALALRRKIHGEEHEEVSAGIHNLGTVLYRKGDYDGAEQLFRQALAMDRELRNEVHPDVANSLNSLGALLEQTGRLDEAADIFQQALDVVHKLYGDDHPEVADNQRNLGEVLLKTGRLADSEKFLQSARKLDEKWFGREHPDVAADLNLLGLLEQRKGNDTKAEAYFRESLELRRKLLKPRNPVIANSLLGLGSTMNNLGQPEQAEPLLREAVELFAGSLPYDHWQIYEARNLWGLSLTMLDRYDEAEETLLLADPLGKAEGGAKDAQTVQALQALAYLYEVSERPEKAQEARRLLTQVQ